MNKIPLYSLMALFSGLAPLANAQFVRCTSPDGQSSTIQRHHSASSSDVETPVTVGRGTAQRVENSERWEFSFASQIGNTYRDLNSIKRSGNLVTVREKVDLFQPEHSIFANPPYEYKSIVSTYEYDCVKSTVRTPNTFDVTSRGERSNRKRRRLRAGAYDRQLRTNSENSIRLPPTCGGVRPTPVGRASRLTAG